jgi:DNA (cytosine-5)-methyltransferase 1
LNLRIGGGDVDNTQNIISFCTGYGGIELGLRRAGVDVRTVCNVEIEAFVQANLVAKIEEGRMDNAPIYSDLKTFPARIFRGKICGIIGGYPCQPFSSAGKRKGEKDPRHLWPYIREHVRAIRPVWCFFENVRGHTTMGLWRVLSDLEKDGYRTEWGLFSAEETGAPHQRIRCFILAYSPGGRFEQCESKCEKKNILSQGSEKQLGDTKFTGLEGFGDKARKRSQGREKEERSVTSTDSGTELAHTASREPRQSQARNGGQDTSGGSEDTQWPARPGEEQYEWEEPRVTEAQSELGGAVDGSACGVDATANRVDRLRLLGNGVVPQTAEIAWKTLWEKLLEQS